MMNSMQSIADRKSVCIKEPHIQSMAARIMLRSYYKELCVKQWVKFRRNYIRKQKELNHGLFCHYCGKQLIESGVNPEQLTQQENELVATVDHIIPLGLGGAERDENNLCVSCRACNNEKDALINYVKSGLINKEQYFAFTKEHMIWRREQAKTGRKQKKDFFRKQYFHRI